MLSPDGKSQKGEEEILISFDYSDVHNVVQNASFALVVPQIAWLQQQRHMIHHVGGSRIIYAKSDVVRPSMESQYTSAGGR